MTSPNAQAKEASHCILLLKNALFKNDIRSKEYVFQKPIESFKIFRPSISSRKAYWAILGPKKSVFLKVVANRYIAVPPLSRTYPLFSQTFNYNKIQFLNFKEDSGLPRIHMSARYESLAQQDEEGLSENVNSTINYITGANNYNSNNSQSDELYIHDLLELFNLKPLKNKWITVLSNGQLRRARIAKALAKRPELLIIDDPFLGLDPEATKLVSNSLEKVGNRLNIAIVLGIRIQDTIPDWVNSVGYIDNEGTFIAGEKREVVPLIKSEMRSLIELHQNHQREAISNDYEEISAKSLESSNLHIEFSNASVVYKNTPILKDFSWFIPKGSKWRIFGANGTGKTTLLSLITADHPQSWRSVLSVDGKVRKTGNGSSFFEVNNKIGISSPELHALVPGSKTMKEVIFSGLKKDVGNANFMFSVPESSIDDFARNILLLFKDRIERYGNTNFAELPISEQKLCLFLRAVIKNPEVLILDEAFSCMDDEELLIRCHKLLERELQNSTVLAIGHIDWELPKCDYMLKLHGDKDRSYSTFKYR
ncbi:uncharacterized protein PRCAT00001547001 [Priceomyces carsonii]|uniref:uncharacterized protein n=1 Tax=Priceomyces carsonii TaxID=28549 RepID=UPI002ED8897B|nr:unnamed protein product [Priceomyces carsonii]